jgi:gas vesicle protein
MSEESNNLGTGILLFLLGAAAGAVVVALTTPKTGPDLRSDIRDLSARLKRRAKAMGGCCEEEPSREAEEGQA